MKSILVALSLTLALALLLLLLTSCGSGGDGVGAGDDATSPAPPSGTKDTTPPGNGGGKRETAALDFGERGNISPENIVWVLPANGGNVLWVDVQAAIEALVGHTDVREELVDSYFEGFDEWLASLGISISDLDSFAFGDIGQGNENLLLLGGVDAGDLKEMLKEQGFTSEGEVWGVETLSDGSGIWAFLGETIAWADDGELMETVLALSDQRTSPDPRELWPTLKALYGYDASDDYFAETLSDVFGIDASRLVRLRLDLDSLGDVFFLDGAHLSRELQQTLADYGLEQVNIGGTEVWLDALEVFAFLGETVLIGSWSELLTENDSQTILDALQRPSTCHEGPPDGYVARLLSSGYGIDPADLSCGQVMIGNEMNSFYLVGGAYAPELRETLADKGFEKYYGTQDVDLMIQWGSGSEAFAVFEDGVLATEYRGTMEEALEFVSQMLARNRSSSFHDEVGALWDWLPQGIFKQIGTERPYVGSFCDNYLAHSISKESDQEFRLTGIRECQTVDDAQEDFEDLEPGDIHRACEATFSLEGRRISFDAICGTEALVDVVDISY